LTAVKLATRIIIGGDVTERNRQALAQLLCDQALQIVPATSALFEEPVKL
jgi:hypothetical protein